MDHHSQASVLVGRTKQMPISEIAEQLNNLAYLERLAHHVEQINSSLEIHSDIKALSIIAEHGTDEDRKIVVAKLKGWFDEFER
jgi:hypothetical protein